MSKLLLSLLLTFSTAVVFSQDATDAYLQTHHYSFSLDSGFDKASTTILIQKLNGCKLLLLGEGGSHFLQFYEPLRFIWVKLLHEQFGMTHFFMEFGHSSDLLCNQYLQTGDSSYLPVARFIRNNVFWTSLFSYNKTQPAGKRMYSFGVDFERTHSCLKALQWLLPAEEPEKNISRCIHLIKTSADTIRSCNNIISINSVVKDDLKKYAEIYKKYLGQNFEDFRQIVFNNSSCADAEKNRNGHMASNFLSFHNKLRDTIYYGQLGMAHTLLSRKTTASIINHNLEFRDKVCVINTYCYNCTTPEEKVSNWQLAAIEKDILTKLLPYCTGDFTLFDFTGSSEVIKRFREYGQLLIVAKNQK